MLTLKITCSMCGREGHSIDINKTPELEPERLKARLEESGWIVQFNGSNFDTYCTKKCAK